MWTEPTMPFGQSVIVSLLGLSVVFLALICLALAIMVISKILRSFSDAWSEKLLQDLLTSSWDKAWVLKEDETVCGYSNFRVIAGEGELMRIAVHGACRGRGYGRLLMERLLREAEEENVEDITLEVRASNGPAIALYEAYGFQKEAVRKNYYSGPTEDALIYWKRSGKSIDR